MATKKTASAKTAKKTATRKTTTRKKKAEETPAAEPETILEAVAAPAEPAEQESTASDRNAEPAELEEDGPAAAAVPAAEQEIESESEVEDETEDAEALPAAPAPHLERLQKILAQAGIASRRHAEELITTGRVQVNGQIVTVLGSKADPARDHIRVDGKLLQGAERLRYFMLHKPKGYVTTVSDPENRPTVMEFFSKTNERLYPVGRLDYLSEGLLLVTNDGELANALTRAAAGVEKTYLVKVSGQPADEELDRLREGVSIDRGQPGEGRVRTAPARVRQVREGENPWFEVVLIEGRNRELRKMFEEIGHHVEKIRRVGYGPLVLDIPVGKTRELDPDEIEALRLTAAGKLKPRRLKTKKMLPRDAGKAVIHDEEERPRGGMKPFFKRPDERSDQPERTGRFEKRSGGFEKPSRGFEKRSGGFEKPSGRFEKRSGGFEKPSRGFEKRPGGFERPSGRLEKRAGGLDRPSGAFEKRPGSFEKPARGFERRTGSFDRPSARFEKPAGRFEKPGGSEKNTRFERPGKFQSKFPPKDRPFRPREERAEGEGRGFAPRRDEFQPRRGGNARFGRPEGGRTGNRRDDRGFRPDDRPQKSFRPNPAGRPFARPAAPRRDEEPAVPRSFTPRSPSRLRIDAVESDAPSSARTAPSSTGRPAFRKPSFDRPAREGQPRPRTGPGGGRPSTGRPAGPGRPPRGEGSSRPFTTSTGIPRAGGARPSSKPGRPAGKSNFGSKPRSGGKSFGSKPGGFSKGGGFKRGPNKGPGFKGKSKPGGQRGGPRS